MNVKSETSKRKYEDAFQEDEIFYFWDVAKVGSFLRENAISDEIIEKFTKEKILGRHLPSLTSDDLEKMEISALGDRITVMELLEQFQQESAIYYPDKVFNDSVHGHISLHPLIVKIIDTPQFQRLRCIKQLGAVYFVFPAAANNRFEHCIGVSYLAGELVKTLKDKQPQLKITMKDKLCVEIAGLCHDLGHGPFSHMFERFVNKARKNVNAWKHENASVKMFHHLIEENNLKQSFEDYGLNDQDIIFITEQIAGPLVQQENNGNIWPYKGRKKEKGFLYEIVANKRNGIDVDKWDYFYRDCHNLGFDISFDYKRFLKFARVISVEDYLQICCRDKEAGNLYDMFYTRNILHRRAYQHRVNNSIESMITDALLAANEYLLTEGKNGVKFTIAETVDDMTAFTKMTDYVFYQILYSSDIRLRPAQDILSRILTRKLYKFIGQSRPEAEYFESDEETIQQEITDLSDGTFTVGEFLVKVIRINYGMEKKNPIDKVYFYRKDNPDMAVKIRKEEVSKMLPNTFAETNIIVYSKNNDKYEHVKIAFEKWCTQKNIPLSKFKLYYELTPLKLSSSSISKNTRSFTSPRARIKRSIFPDNK